MNKKQGFTLVELLVVMAIIAILASIAIPNVIGGIKRARATQALSEIQGIETALTKMISDSGRDSLHHLFNPAGIAARMGGNTGACVTNDQFRTATEIYTRCLYALLREGRAALNQTDDLYGSYSTYLRSDVVRKLGTNYMDVAKDPWGNLYNIYPGPWSKGYNKLEGRGSGIPFRSYQLLQNDDLPGGGSMNQTVKDNELIVTVEDVEAGGFIEVGYPASYGLSVYIWSAGENLQSSQALYNSGTGINAYDLPQGEEFAGGGDDINNWDPETSWNLFY